MTVLLYFAQVSLYAAIMCGIYFIVWRNRPLHTYSRVYLLASLVLPVVLPFIHLPLSPQYATAVYSVTLSQVSIAPSPAAQSSREVLWPEVLAWLYVGGCLLLAALYARAYVRLNVKLRQGRRVQYNGHTIIKDTEIGPGTLGTRIFFPSDKIDRLIVQHELAHIQAGHRYDSLLLQVMHVIFWVSPAHWLLGRELKTVHEFEADKIASEGVDTVDYASLLLSQSFGAPHSFAIAHSFFRHPLKRRIMMLQKMKTPKGNSLLIAAAALTVGFMSTVLLAQTKGPANGGDAPLRDSTAVVIDMDVVAKNTPPKAGEISLFNNGTIAFKTVEKMPAFNGDLQGWLRSNMQYPDSIRADKAKGGCMMQFTVAEDGAILSPQLLRSSGDAGLDSEAMRVVSKMPKWLPGIQKGKPVPVIFTMAIFFKPNMGGC